MKKMNGTIRIVRDAFTLWRLMNDVLIVVMGLIFGLAGLTLIVSGQWEHAVIGVVLLGIVAWAFFTRFKDRRKIRFVCGRCSMQWKEPPRADDHTDLSCPRCGSDDVSN